MDTSKFPRASAFLLGHSEGFLGIPPSLDGLLPVQVVSCGSAWYKIGYEYGKIKRETWWDTKLT
jgi:hypothetical protein